jgi:hypothetical protein
VRALRTYLERAPKAADAEQQKTKIANLEKQIAAEKPVPSATATATAQPTGTAAPTAPPPSADSGGGGHTLPPWIVVGLGGALVVTGVVLQPIGLHKVSEAERECPDHNACPPAGGAKPNVDYAKVVETGNDGRSLSTVGVVLIVAGFAVAGGGLAWHFLEPTGPKAARVTPSVAPGYAGLQLGGRF